MSVLLRLEPKSRLLAHSGGSPRRPRRSSRPAPTRRAGSGRGRAAPCARRLGGGELLLGRLQLVLHAAQLLELLRRRLALQLLPARAARRRAARARASARRPRAARRTPPPRPCARARRGSRPGSLRAALRSITRRESRYASIRRRRPAHAFLVDRRADEVGDGEHLLVRVRDGDARSRPSRAARGRSRRRRTRPCCSRVKPSRSATKLEAGALRHVRARELEEVRQRLRDEQPARRSAPSSAPRAPSSASGSPTRRASSAASAASASRSPTAWIGEVLEVGVGARLRRSRSAT